jgi:hypothetical protein
LYKEENLPSSSTAAGTFAFVNKASCGVLRTSFGLIKRVC